ncbi:hypothetical protein GF339_21005 [candidate division KSB3 bacterium]|uniref:Uroporphyrinogen decarboxylase (URO-D) domain-containing protein n=1 Tax=candidate division KSB3 bacterium TaxID=2044937 RepID=A0A9D5JZH8_9BACT|nr:hypothetical protein [candidate division KSB3 bacterium]MBD3327079.1 hypothetical protein [candidate division KSB3 bacterium]
MISGKRRMPMTPSHAENLLTLLHGGEPDWMPFTLDVGAIPGLTKPILKRFAQETGREHPEEYFNYDFRTFSLQAHFGGQNPSAWHDHVEVGTYFDEWGIGHWAGGAEASYEKMFHPLAQVTAVREIERFPSPRFDTEVDQTRVQAYHARGYPVFGYAGSIYEWSWWLRGMQNFMTDLLLQPAIAEAIIRKVSAYTQALAYQTALTGIDVLCFYDDAGMQTGMQISPKLWRTFIKPSWQQILDHLRAAFPQIHFLLHSCGNIRAIIPDIIELGFDILHPVQPECMDFQDVKATFGRDIVLCATLSAQHTFPFGTPDEIRATIRRVHDICSDNRCILCPSNAIQPETPWDNIIAFVEEATAGRPSP